MADKSTYYGFTRPNKNDYYSIDVYNSNITLIDEALNAKRDLESVVPIEKGGTGAKNVADAKTALGLNKTLWFGNWSSGPITVPEINNYRVLIVGLVGNATGIVVVRLGNVLRGMGLNLTAGGYQIVAGFQGSVNGTTITKTSAGQMVHTFNGNHGTYDVFNVEHIVGLI